METTCTIGGMLYRLDFALTSKKDFALFQGIVAVNPVLQFSYCKWYNAATSIFEPYDISETVKTAIITAVEKYVKEEVISDAF